MSPGRQRPFIAAVSRRRDRTFVDANPLIDDLLRPDAWPERPARVDLIETHISWVLLAGDRVLKIKRPVSFAFVDFTSLDARHRACLDEARLNRRLTDGVYLDVVPITRSGGRHIVGGDGEPVEWGTLMRRLPAEGMLDALLAHRAVPYDLAGHLADRLIPFHTTIAAPCAGSLDELAASTTDVLTDNLDELAPFAGRPLAPTQLALVADAMRAFLATHAGRVHERAAHGWIRDGHGDLRCEHVCLDERDILQIFDCVEFSAALRCADVASDLAFLLMDLTRLGGDVIARDLLARYRSAGVNLPADLLRLYWAHRALVRAKVACLRARQEDEDEMYTREAAGYLDLAAAKTLAVQPAIVAMTGLSGTGKSTVARRLARVLDIPSVASDAVRKELAGVTGSAAAAWGEGIYSADWTAATYARLYEHARAALANDHAVILDATFLKGDERQRAAETARGAGVPFVLVETVCDEAEVLRRLAARQASGRSASDASLQIYRSQREAMAAAPPPVPAGAIAITVDTSGSGPVSLDPALIALANADLVTPAIPVDQPLFAASH